MTSSTRAYLKAEVDKRMRDLVGRIPCECNHCDTCRRRRKRAEELLTVYRSPFYNRNARTKVEA